MFSLFRPTNHDLLDEILTTRRTIMTAIDDLNAAVANMQSAVTAAITDIQTLTQELAAAGNDDPAIESAVATLNGIATNLQSAVTPPAATTTAATSGAPSS